MITWGKFREIMEDNGVSDDDLIAYIDIDGYEGINRVKAEHTKTPGVMMVAVE